MLREDAAELLEGLRWSAGSCDPGRSAQKPFGEGRDNAEQIPLQRSASLTWHEASSVRISPRRRQEACFCFAVCASLGDRRSLELCQERATRLQIRLWSVSGKSWQLSTESQVGRTHKVGDGSVTTALALLTATRHDGAVCTGDTSTAETCVNRLVPLAVGCSCRRSRCSAEASCFGRRVPSEWGTC